MGIAFDSLENGQAVHADINGVPVAVVRIDDEVRASATVAEINPKGQRVHLRCQCSVGETVVLEGEAVVKVPSRPAPLNGL